MFRWMHWVADHIVPDESVAELRKQLEEARRERWLTEAKRPDVEARVRAIRDERAQNGLGKLLEGIFTHTPPKEAP